MPGRYRIFLGMAAGVGKTYRMLAEAQAEAEAGRDVVIGLLETHGRAETEALAEGLEVVPRRRVAVPRRAARGDGPAGRSCRARPELCLIDELAHTNAPGLEHPKRYEDIADVLAAGIDVFSTVNVQHLESLNDQVAELTGVRVRETVPDDELEQRRRDRARRPAARGPDRPPAGRQGLRAARVPAALNGFFRVENLRALREVALRQVAETVEARRVERAADRRAAAGVRRASTSATSASCAARGAPPSGSAASSTCSWSRPESAAVGGASAQRLEALRRLDGDARRAPAGRGGRRARGRARARRPRARHDLHPARPAAARRRLRRAAAARSSCARCPTSTCGSSLSGRARAALSYSARSPATSRTSSRSSAWNGALARGCRGGRSRTAARPD